MASLSITLAREERSLGQGGGLFFLPLLCPSLRSTSTNVMQCSSDSYLQKHQQGFAEQKSPHCSFLSYFLFFKTNTFSRQRCIETAYSKLTAHNTTAAYLHVDIHLFLYCELHSSTSLLALSSYSPSLPLPSSTQR